MATMDNADEKKEGFQDGQYRRQLEERAAELRISEERFRIAAQSVSDLIWDWDVSSGRVEWFGDIDGMLGFQPGGFPRTMDAWENTIHPEDCERVKKARRQHLLDCQPFSVKYRMIGRDGTVFHWIDRGTGVWNETGEAVRMIGAATDITKPMLADDALRKNMKELGELNRRIKENQAQLIQSEKMASLGQLAAGIAHEINNPVGFVRSNLGTLSGYVGILKRLMDLHICFVQAVQAGDAGRQSALMKEIDDLAKSEDLAFILDDVDVLLSQSIDGADRVKDIVQNLKSFARLDEAEVMEADLNECIESTLKIVWNELKYKCRVEKKLGKLPMIRCYPGQLNQVFMNLLVNAAQAISEKGDIIIETEAVGQEIVIRISDTGAGILPEQFPKLFTPFYTTKPVGKGTGLGLPISYGIVKKHNGTIQVESAPGKLTTFTIRLPLDGVAEEVKP
ncbi:MAG: ATP-binding protein [Verrucomicrobiae bacterium]|nr:ATP-binding protein [Verrucomicrobiae bacterium]